MCPPNPICLHGCFGELHDRCLGGVLCCSQPSSWILYPSSIKNGSEMPGNGATRSAISIILLRQETLVLLTTPSAVELSVWIGLLGCGHPMSMRVWQWGIISHAAIKRAASLDSAADEVTDLMSWAMESTAPLKRGYGSFLERKMCAPARLQNWVSLRKPALACVHRIMSLAR
jgi:hypothetical protein